MPAQRGPDGRYRRPDPDPPVARYPRAEAALQALRDGYQQRQQQTTGQAPPARQQ